MNNEFEKNKSENNEIMPEGNSVSEEFQREEASTSYTEETACIKPENTSMYRTEEPSYPPLAENSDMEPESYTNSDVTISYGEGYYGSAPVPAEPVMEETAKKAEKKPQKFGWILLKVIALMLVGGIVFGAGFFAINKAAQSILNKRNQNVKIGTTEYELKKSDKKAPESEIATIAQLRMPSIVAITNRSVSDVVTFFGTYSQESTSSGSGIIIGQNDTELLIVTNYHVVSNSKELSVVFSAVESELEAQAGSESQNFDNERIPKATVKGYDAEKDLAVIAVTLADIPEDIVSKIEVAPIGDSSTLLPGDQVIAIGNSLGYGQSVTTGIISAVNRKITMQGADGYSTVTNTFIQTDAAINQGNSGGALLDMAGNVIGINSVKIATTGVEGMGYAIPISDVESIIQELMTQKTRSIADENKQGFLGITGGDVQARETEMYGVPAGVYVSDVTKGLAADNAGIKKGYIITKFDNQTITSIAQLQEKLRYYESGEKVNVTVQIPENGGYKEKVLEVKLSNRSENMGE